MKKKYVTWFLLFCLGGCGVHVGNGMKDYESKHGYAFRYDSERLRLIESSDGKSVELDNASQITEEDQRASSMYLAVDTESNPRTVAELTEIAAKENPNKDFREAKFGDGTVGIISVGEIPDTLYSVNAYMVTPIGALVRIAVIAFAGGDGINLFKGVVGSLKGSENNVVEGQTISVRRVPTLERGAVTFFTDLGYRVAATPDEQGRYALTPEGRVPAGERTEYFAVYKEGAWWLEADEIVKKIGLGEGIEFIRRPTSYRAKLQEGEEGWEIVPATDEEGDFNEEEMEVWHDFYRQINFQVIPGERINFFRVRENPEWSTQPWNGLEPIYDTGSERGLR